MCTFLGSKPRQNGFANKEKYVGKIIQWDLVPFGMGLLTHNLGSDKDISVRTKGKIS